MITRRISVPYRKIFTTARLRDDDDDDGACKDIKRKTVPALVFGVEGRYATALYRAAFKMKQLEMVENEVKCLQEVFKKNKELYENVISPAANRKQLAKTLMTSVKKAGMSNAFGNFLSTMAYNGRMKRYNGVANAFATIMTADRGDVECEVTTAKPLDDASQSELVRVLQRFIREDQRVKLKLKVDPELIGGMVVSIGDRFVDMSISAKIKMYSDLISAPA